MWAFVRTVRLLLKTLSRIAVSLEDIAALYRLDLASRNITPTDPRVSDRVEVAYGYHEEEGEG